MLRRLILLLLVAASLDQHASQSACAAANEIPGDGTVSVRAGADLKYRPEEKLKTAVTSVDMKRPQNAVPGNVPVPYYYLSTFNNATPAVCSIDCIVRALPDNSVVQSFLNGKISWTIEEVVGSTLSWRISTPYQGSTAVYSSSYKEWTSWAEFTGLPEHNSSFGRKKATYSVSGTEFSKSGIAKVFFNRDALNHPGAGSGTTPNWYYYWIEGNVVAGLSDMTYAGASSQLLGKFEPPSTLNIYMGAADSQASIKVSHLFWFVDESVDPPTYDANNGFWTGKAAKRPSFIFAARKGIDLCRSIILHEKKHKSNYDAIHTGGGYDADTDGCPDVLEGDNSGSPYYFSAKYADTYNWEAVYDPYKFNGDDEMLARRAGEDVNDNDLKPDEDWSDTNGRNWHHKY